MSAQEFLKPRNRLVIGLALAGAIATAAVSVYNVNQLTKRETAPPPAPVAPVVTSVTALGRLEPLGEVIYISASNSLQGGGSRVEQLLVKQGQRVNAGDVIAILDNRDRLLAALEQARQQVAISQANLAQVRAGAKSGEISAQQAAIARLKAELEGLTTTSEATLARLRAEQRGEINAQLAKVTRLQAELRNAEAEYKRYRDLYQEEAISVSILDAKRLVMETNRQQVNEAEATRSQTSDTLAEQINEQVATQNQTKATLQQQIKEAEANLNSIKEVRPTDVQAARAQVQSAIAAVKQAQADLDLASVRTPIAGKIIEIYTKAGEAIGNDGVVSLGETDKMAVVAEVYESDIGKVKIGQKAVITGDAFTGELQGTVSQIASQINKKDVLDTDPAADVDSRVVEVKIALNSAASRQVADLTNLQVDVKINI